MSKTWLRIKLALLSILFIYILIFVFKNSALQSKFWYFFNENMEFPTLYLVGFTFAAGVLFTLLVRTTLSTFSQMRMARERSKTEKLHRDVAETKAKADMLQGRAPVAPPSITDLPRVP